MRRRMSWLIVLGVAVALLLAAPAPPAPSPTFGGVPLGPVWAAAERVERAYVGTGAVPVRVLSDGTLAAMAATAGEDPEALAADAAAMVSRPPAAVPAGFEDVWRAWRLLADTPVDEAPEEVVAALVRGMVSATGDPNALVLVGAEVSEGEEYVEDGFQGIGALVDARDGSLVVSLPFPGGPADRAGVRSGDVVVAVDGQPVDALSGGEVIDLVRGPSGAPVQLLLGRDGDEVEVTVVREEFEMATVSFHLHPDGIGQLSITRLGESTPEEVDRQLELLVVQGIRGLILDLRMNAGGRRSAAVAVADEFLDGGVVYLEQDLDGSMDLHQASSGGLAPALPLIAVVDQRTAGAAEILAAALRDHGRARLLGARTAGQGVIYSAYPVSDALALVIPSGTWRTPAGRSVQGVGLAPDLGVPLIAEDVILGQDRQLLAAYGVLWASLQGGATADAPRD